VNPPRWFLRAAWAFHKGLYAISAGRLGLEAPTGTKLGTLRLRTRGRRSGEPRAAFVFYVEEGTALAVVASNAGADREPGWWLNLQARSEAEVDVVGASRPVRARVADPDARARVMARFVALDPRYGEYEDAAGRPIDVVLLEPR
jgi:deazaflavin-dependent oxidoreductase (nitroreductase family)